MYFELKGGSGCHRHALRGSLWAHPAVLYSPATLKPDSSFARMSGSPAAKPVYKCPPQLLEHRHLHHSPYLLRHPKSKCSHSTMCILRTALAYSLYAYLSQAYCVPGPAIAAGDTAMEETLALTGFTFQRRKQTGNKQIYNTVAPHNSIN